MIRLSDLILFQFGRRGAIERVASSCWALVIGFVLVGTAVLARNYDGVSLVAQPEFILRPYAASIASSFLMFLLAFFTLGLGGSDRAGFGWQYLAFLGLFWLTAPIAWLYAIPVEHWWGSLAAAKWNVGMLAVVSIWRVALISRVLYVLTGCEWWRSLLTVLCPACFEVFGAMLAQVDLLAGMGGVQLTDPPDRQFMKEVNQMVTGAAFWSSVAAIAILIGLLVKRCGTDRSLPRPRFLAAPWLTLGACVIALACWFGLATRHQPKLRHLANMETLISQQEYDEALDYLETHGVDAFPANRAIPPDPWAVSHDYRLSQMLTALDEDRPAWMVDLYRNHAMELMKRYENAYIAPELLDALLSHPSGADFVRQNQQVWQKAALFRNYSGDQLLNEEIAKRLESIGIEAPNPEP